MASSDDAHSAKGLDLKERLHASAITNERGKSAKGQIGRTADLVCPIRQCGFAAGHHDQMTRPRHLSNDSQIGARREEAGLINVAKKRQPPSVLDRAMKRTL